MIVWISEDQRFAGSKDIYGRIFTSERATGDAGIPAQHPLQLFAPPRRYPPLNNGGFTAAWSEKANQEFTNGWDVSLRPFSANGARFVRTRFLSIRGDMATNTGNWPPGPNGVLAVWTSMGRMWLTGRGFWPVLIVGGMMPTGNEFEVNTHGGQRTNPSAAAWNGVDRFVVIWSSMTLGSGFDL